MHLPIGITSFVIPSRQTPICLFSSCLRIRGSGFDIVSGGELQRILQVNKKAARRVVFSGVEKTSAEIDLALAADILIFNVESESEVALLAERARSRRVRARVALRVNPDVFAETHPYISTGPAGEGHKFWNRHQGRASGVPGSKAIPLPGPDWDQRPHRIADSERRTFRGCARSLYPRTHPRT